MNNANYVGNNNNIEYEINPLSNAEVAQAKKSAHNIAKQSFDYAFKHIVDSAVSAARGVEAAKSWRNQVASEMQPSQIAEAQKLAREWLNIFK